MPLTFWPCSKRHMPRLLLINPNTSTAVSALLQAHAQAAAGPQVQVDVVTARFGAPYISCEASFAVAGHAVLDAWAAAQATAQAPYDAVLIACFGDPGLLALRQICPVPITGLAEAAFLHASRLGRFAVVTGGAAWKPMLERLAHNLGYDQGQLAGVHTVVQTGAELARDPVAARVVLTQACKDAASASGASAVILGGAGLAGMAQDLQPGVPVPVIDSVSAGVHHALDLCGSPVVAPQPLGFAWSHVSPELAATGTTM